MKNYHSMLCMLCLSIEMLKFIYYTVKNSETIKSKTRGRLPNRNVLQNTQGPRNTATTMSNPSDRKHYVQHTNPDIKSVHESFPLF